MYEWQQQIQKIVDEIDNNLLENNEEALTLNSLSNELGYSEFYTTRKFKEISGMSFKDYLRLRKLAFALKEVRDTDKNLLDIAMNYGFSSHEAFTRAFKSTYGVTPKAYRKNPKPLVLRTKINVFDRYSFGLNELGMIKSTKEVKVYFITIPAHKFVYIQNYESSGFFDFWRKQNQIKGQDYETICGIFDSLKGKLDDVGETIPNSASGQIMAYIYNPNGRLCEWGFPRTECWGARLPASYKGDIPSGMEVLDVAEADYIVFEHGPFNYNQENWSVEVQVEEAMSTFDYSKTDYELDITSPGRIIYFFHDPKQYFKYIRPVRKRIQE